MYETQFNKLLKKSIKRIPRPFCLLVSGGVDSGLLAAVSKPDMVATMHMPVEDERFNEFNYAMRVITHLGLEDKFKEIKLDFSEATPQFP